MLSHCPMKTPRPISFKTWRSQFTSSKGHGPVFATEEERRLSSWLCTIVSYRGKQVKRRPRVKQFSRKNTSWTPEKWTKEDQLELFSDFSFNDRWFCLLVVVLLFNFKGRNKTIWPKGFSLRKKAWEHFLLDHISWKYPWCLLQNPRNYWTPLMIPLLNEGRKVKQRREDMLQGKVWQKHRKSC